MEPATKRNTAAIRLARQAIDLLKEQTRQRNPPSGASIRKNVIEVNPKGDAMHLIGGAEWRRVVDQANLKILKDELREVEEIERRIAAAEKAAPPIKSYWLAGLARQVLPPICIGLLNVLLGAGAVPPSPVDTAAAPSPAADGWFSWKAAAAWLLGAIGVGAAKWLWVAFLV